jgi:hypothetical protein
MIESRPVGIQSIFGLCTLAFDSANAGEKIQPGSAEFKDQSPKTKDLIQKSNSDLFKRSLVLVLWSLFARQS